MSFRVIRIDQGRSAPDIARNGICEIVGLPYIPHEIECRSHKGTERAPLACCRNRWVYLQTMFIPCERCATPVVLICNERAGSFDDGSSKGL
jgi:hypothetical protein